jgi:endonuclease/exonuclease/phosphatase family metal-dependent hydrolase
MNIQVVTYNMGMGAKREDGKPLASKNEAFDMFVRGFSDLVGTENVPWFLCLQEIDRDNAGQNQVEELQQGLEKNTGLDWRKHSETRDGGDGEAVAIFSTRPLEKVQRYDLGDDRRGLAVKARLAEDQYLWVVTAHLLRGGEDSSGDTRTAEIIELLQHIVTFDPTVPVVFTGDLNVADPTPGTHSDEVDTDPELYTRTVGRFLRLEFTRGAGFVPTADDITFHAWSDTSDQNEVWDIIDYICVNQSGKCTAQAPSTINFQVDKADETIYASDHKGVLMEIEYP